MAKKQTRRSISLNRGLFEQAKEHANTRLISLSKFTEDAIRTAMSPGILAEQLTILRARVEALATTEGLPDVVAKYLQVSIDEVDALVVKYDRGDRFAAHALVGTQPTPRELQNAIDQDRRDDEASL